MYKGDPLSFYSIEKFLSTLPPQGSSVSERAVEERAIAFAEWLQRQPYELGHGTFRDKWFRFDILSEEQEGKTTSELFALFQQQQSK